jgi:hypothetical protein
MSKIKVNEIEAATGSTVTIPTGQTFTVTDGIPATNLSGTIADARLPTVPVTKGGTGLTSLGTANQVVAVNSGANALEFQDASSGKIGQVIQSHKADSFSTTNGIGGTGFTEVTGLSTTITPSATSSKIWVTGSIMVSDSSPNRVFLRLHRDSTSIGQASDSGLSSTECHKSAYAGGTTSNAFNVSFNFLDTPNTTSAITYKVMICQNQPDGNSTVFVNRHNNSASGSADDHTTSQLTLMEILA